MAKRREFRRPFGGLDIPARDRPQQGLSALRRRKEDQLDEEQAAEIEDHSDTPEATLQKKNKSELLRACLKHLSPLHREVVDLVYYHDKSVEEVAAIVGAPEGTVKTRMFHARKRLRNWRKRRGLIEDGHD